MRTVKLPSIPILVSESKQERIIHYRKFFADLRLDRLHLQLIILNHFSNLGTSASSKSFAMELENYISFFKKMNGWVRTLQREGLYSEFQEQCIDEIKAIEQIIHSYEEKMKN